MLQWRDPLVTRMLTALGVPELLVIAAIFLLLFAVRAFFKK